MAQPANIDRPMASCFAYKVVNQMARDPAATNDNFARIQAVEITGKGLHSMSGNNQDAFQAILHARTAAIMIFERSGRIVAMNDFAELLFGCDSPDCMSRNFDEFIVHDYCQTFAKCFIPELFHDIEDYGTDSRKIIAKRPDQSMFLAKLVISETVRNDAVFYVSCFEYCRPIENIGGVSDASQVH